MTRQILSISRAPLAVLAASLLLLTVLAGCNQTPKHPDVKDAVNTAMTRSNLGVVKVSQDREKGVITLTGDVESEDQKTQAEGVAAQAAPGNAISNEIGVRPVGEESQAKAVDSNLDDAIEDNFKASLKATRRSRTQPQLGAATDKRHAPDLLGMIRRNNSECVNSFCGPEASRRYALHRTHSLP